ncbi:MAG: tRNA (guanosine(37)-N1)-methyltransferase TrmD [Lachnospiraceae bacterium]|nr:tRNA (guanosine(37)-N1)-methyltransferase TrmD [Lachnospiraceae bacterium]
MNFHVLTLFPDMILNGLETSITGRAILAGTISIEAVNIRDYTVNKHKKVDDYPYGGGAGMLMQAQPVYDAWKAVEEKICQQRKRNRTADENADGGTEKPQSTRVIYLSPQGTVFNQQMAKELAKEEDLIFLCGHYEGIDERVLEEIVTDYVSIGDYVLTGGELPAMVMIDAVARMVPGVLSNQESGENESFSNYLLEYPQYSRPEVWRAKKVPEILLSGNHQKVEEWRLEQSLERTRQLRPELYEKWKSENQEYFIRKAKKEERQRKKLLKQIEKQTAVNQNGDVGEESANEEDIRET